MAQKYPQDEFDLLAADLTVRGAHRKPRGARSWVLAVIAILILAPLCGVLIHHLVSGNSANVAQSSETEQSASTPNDANGQNAPADPNAAGGQADPNVQPQGQATPAPQQPAPEPDKQLHVVVLNARGETGLAARNANTLAQAGMPNITAADWRGGAEPAQSTVLYADPAHEVTAKFVAQTLGISQVSADQELVNAYQVAIVVVLR
ncbi:LytR C-terminal domain-containing protein [Trueperella sp. LYQ141]|uniref:LytR C-terminal domain-containing protein n=1 Tax=Trueperella sp. LYQ141 TaxID=3391058 RepID=UPI00398344F2